MVHNQIVLQPLPPGQPSFSVGVTQVTVTSQQISAEVADFIKVNQVPQSTNHFLCMLIETLYTSLCLSGHVGSGCWTTLLAQHIDVNHSR